MIMEQYAMQSVHALWQLRSRQTILIREESRDFVLWDFIRQWSYSSNRCGLGILDYDAMLYPCYADHYDKVISEEIWESLQEEAKKKLEQAKKNKEFASPNVVEHWRSIVDGKVPFGFRVGND